MPSPDRKNSRESVGSPAETDEFDLSAGWDAEGIAALAAVADEGLQPEEPDDARMQGEPAPWFGEPPSPKGSNESSWLDRKLADIAAKLEGTLRQQDPTPALMSFGERLDNFEARVEAAVERASRSEDSDSLRFIEAHVREMDEHFVSMRNQIARLATIDGRVAEIWNHVQLDLPAPGSGLAGLVEGAVTRALTAASVLRNEASHGAGQSISVVHLARIEEALERIIERVEAIEEASAYLRADDPWRDMDRLDAAYSEGMRALGGAREAAAWSPVERGHVLHAEDYTVPPSRRIHSLAEVLPAEPLVPPPMPEVGVEEVRVEEVRATEDVAPQTPAWDEQSEDVSLDELRQSVQRARERMQSELDRLDARDAEIGEAPKSEGQPAETRDADEEAYEPPARRVRDDGLGIGRAPAVPLASPKRPLSQGRWYRGFFLAGAMLAVGGISFAIVGWSMSRPGDKANPAVPASEAASRVARSDSAQGDGNKASPIALPPTTEIESPGAAARAEALPATIASASLRHAAANGEPAAEFEIAARFADGRGVTADLQQAFVWYQRSSMHGFAPAQFRLGAYYERGIGTEKDVERAKLWYRRAAEKGHVKAMHNLAVLAANAMPKPDFAGAAQWFREAAERNLPDSQFNLAMLYETGRGVAENQAEAFKWYSIALRNGDLEAGRRMEFVRGRLSKGELAAAEKAVGSFVPTPISAMPGNSPSERAAP